MIDVNLEKNSNIENETAGINRLNLKRGQENSEIKIPFKFKYMEQIEGVYIYEYTQQNVIKLSKIDSSIFKENKLYLIIDIIYKKFSKITKTYFIAPSFTTNQLLFDQLIVIVKKMIDIDSTRMKTNSSMFLVGENDQPNRFVEILRETNEKFSKPEVFHNPIKRFGESVRSLRKNLLKNQMQNEKFGKYEIFLNYNSAKLVHRDVKLKQNVYSTQCNLASCTLTNTNENYNENSNENYYKNHDIINNTIKLPIIKNSNVKTLTKDMNDENTKKVTKKMSFPIEKLKLESSKNNDENPSSSFVTKELENKLQTICNDCKDNKDKLQVDERSNYKELKESMEYKRKSSLKKPIEYDYPTQNIKLTYIRKKNKESIPALISVENVMSVDMCYKSLPIIKNSIEKIESIQSIQDEDERLDGKNYLESLVTPVVKEKKINNLTLLERIKKFNLFKQFSIFQNPTNNDNTIEIKNSEKGKKVELRMEKIAIENANQKNSNKNQGIIEKDKINNQAEKNNDENPS